MTDCSTDETRLQQQLKELTEHLPRNPTVVPLPTARTFSRTEVLTGVVLPLGLASPALCQPGFGQHARADRPRILVFDRQIDEDDIPHLMPLLDDSAREGTHLIVAAPNYDEMVLSLFIQSQPSLSLSAIMPVSESREDTLDLLARMCEAPVPFSPGPGLDLAPAGSLGTALMGLQELVALGPRSSTDPEPGPIGLFWVGGRTPEEALAYCRLVRTWLQTRR